MLKRILIANRGEIAMRIIRAARQLGIETVLVYSRADEGTKPVRFAAKAVCVGGAAASGSYLNQESIIQTAISMECDAIHPGYGFLSENAEFAEKCISHGIRFIGPTPEVIRQMGDKQSARKLMRANGVPVVPGSDGIVPDAAEAERLAEQIGYPVLLKATAGGGGRGMRIARDGSEIGNAFSAASAEASAAFGDGRLYLEKLIRNPRHIEVQILGDMHGNIVHLGERDCSLQRRNQKMIEESPAYCLDEETRGRIREAALKAAKAVNYSSAGTVEFVLGEDGFYFIEMNTRIQVEHPVTEMVTGVDLVREQLMIAGGDPLSVRQEDVTLSGAAIECRINAEDISRNFAPSPGTISKLCFPCGAGVRVESALVSGSTVSPWYDSMIAKVIVQADNRQEAIRKMKTALDETIIEGIPTNISFLKAVMDDRAYENGKVDTGYISRMPEAFPGIQKSRAV